LIFCQGLQILVICDGSITDLGFFYNIQVSVNLVQDYFDNQINISLVDNVTTSTNACFNKAQQYIAMGYGGIVLTTLAYTNCSQLIATAYPNVTVLLGTASPLNPIYPNISIITKVAGLNELRYMVGTLAGFQNNVDTLCFTYASALLPPIGRLWSNIQYLAFNKHKPNGKYYYVETTSFNNPVLEDKTFDYFMNVSCDIIISQLNSFYLPKLANDHHIYSVAWGSDMRQFAGEYVLTSIEKNWYVPIIEWVTNQLEGNYTQRLYEDTIANHGVQLSPFSCLTTPKAIKKVAETQIKIDSGKLNILCGDLVKQQFGHRCATEEQLSSVYLPGMVVKNINDL